MVNPPDQLIDERGLARTVPHILLKAPAKQASPCQWPCRLYPPSRRPTKALHDVRNFDGLPALSGQQMEKDMSQSKSPAVQAYELDKANRQEREAKGELDQALEDTFPASDPVSHSITSVAGAPQKSDAAERETFVEGARGFIKKNPIAAVAMTAAVAWILGATR